MIQDFIEHRLQPLKKQTITVKKTEGKLDYQRRPYNDSEVADLVRRINEPSRETSYYRNRMSELRSRWGGLEVEGLEKPTEKTVSDMWLESAKRERAQFKTYLCDYSFAGTEGWVAVQVSRDALKRF